ncbi:TonB-dependent receptor [Pseudopedobacter beijingensis]|uniref:TonB-dependent receptor domain-containing protein n=1 Tax=Pseudopedobacter beijingensis TaxID=1207056 RepID=A0ABW4IF65_9SPHI
MIKHFFTHLLFFTYIVTSFNSFSQPVQTAHALKVFIFSSVDKTPIDVASAELQMGNKKYRSQSNQYGIIQFANLPAGKYFINISCIGFKQDITEISLSKDQTLNIFLQPDEQKLQQVTITASESKNLSTSSIIDKKAMSHLQPSSFTDLLELLPGGRSIDPKLTQMNQIKLREVGLSSSQYDFSSLGTSFYMDGMLMNTSGNMQISTNYTTSAANDNITAANRGVDMRTISTDQIEKVEIIRGIPSAEYGDLISGVILIERKKGESPYLSRFKADGFSKSIYIGKGFSFPKSRQTFNIDLSYLNSKQNPTNNFLSYKRVNTSLRTSKVWNERKTTYTLSNNLDYSTNIDNKRVDPENGYALTDSYNSKYHDIGLSNELNVKFSNSNVWKSLNFKSSINYTYSFVDEVKFIQTKSVSVLTNSLEAGDHYAKYALPNYVSELEIEGKPLNIYLKASTALRLKHGLFNHNLAFGSDYRYTKNFGKGQVYDLDKPTYYTQTGTMSVRPRAFSDIPAMNNLSFYAEDKLIAKIDKHILEAAIGARANALIGMNNSYTIANKLYIDPRINSRWHLPKVMVNEKPLLLTIGAGYGIHTKFPTLDQLYPTKNYKDFIQLNYYHNNPEYRTAHVKTYITDATNFNLKPITNNKWEISSDINYNRYRLTVTYFNEITNSGFRNQSEYHNFNYRLYDINSIDATTITQKPVVEDFQYKELNEFYAYTMVTNGGKLIKKGLEYTLQTPRFEQLYNARFTINGAWFQNIYTNSMPVNKVINSNFLDSKGLQRQYVGLYNDDDGYYRSSFNTNAVVDTYLPQLGLTLSSAFQSLWFSKRKNQWKSGTPYAYKDINGNIYPFTSESEKSADLKPLIQDYSRTDFEMRTVPIDLRINFKATKEFKNKAEISMFVNRIFMYVPNYRENNIIIIREIEAPYFGMELKLTL